MYLEALKAILFVRILQPRRQKKKNKRDLSQQTLFDRCVKLHYIDANI